MKNGLTLSEVEKKFGEFYTEKSLLEKIANVFKKAGSELIRKSLEIYYALKDDDTPAWAKGVLIGALGYFISPIDAIPDITPIVGYSDDLMVLTTAIVVVGAHIKEIHKKLAEEHFHKWFSTKAS